MTGPKVLKTISQETFDSVVKENIEDFEMDDQEALNDAIKQFESQVSIQALDLQNCNISF